MQKEIYTERLFLRPLRAEDYIQAFRWCSDPEVNKFMSYGIYTDPQDVKEWLETLPFDDEYSYTYAIILKDSGEMIGSTGMYYHEDRDFWNFGYNLIPSMWNKGYATEATGALVEYVRSIMDVKVIECEHAVDNPASGKVMEKLGLQHIGYGEYTKSDTGEVFISKVYRKEY
ncbi:MAG: GNAT family N-acetyltransferase [Eubacteriaceae bacterium]|nr:GNAT family N-acetyltransferase [Eubacteriaceae bacterium]